MGREHHYTTEIVWTGNTGTGTSGYRDFSRDHEVRASGPGGPPTLPASSDPAFRGDPARWNPEQLLVASLSQCHMLWLLHLAAGAGVVVTGYVDRPDGVMAENADGSGQFTRVTLRPEITVTEQGMVAALPELHERAHGMCFIARSVGFPVGHEPVTRVG